MTGLIQDFRYALRQFAKNPGFTAIAVITLALGIGANSTIFSWINSTLLNPIPGVSRTGDMVTIMRGERSEHPTPPFSYFDYVDLRDNTTTFSGLLAYHDYSVVITGDDNPQRIYAALTSANYFDVLGVRPILGRGFVAGEEKERTGAAVIVLGYGVWQDHFGADPAIVGKKIQINFHPYTIIGVAPKGFIGCKTGLRQDVWIPLGMDEAVWGNNRLDNRGTPWLNVLGKLKPGVDHRQAEEELNVLMQRVAAQYPISHQTSNQITTDPLWRSPFGVNVYLASTLPILLVLAATLLLLACANVANLLLVRSIGRRRELAIRLSMGANRGRLVRQLLMESLLLALAGGGLAMLFTMWGAGTLSAFVPATTLPINLNGHADQSVLFGTILISVLAAGVAGVLPALRASNLSPIAILKEEAASTSSGLHKSRLSSGLVVAQISLSLVLLICAGLFVRTLQNAQKSDIGFDPNHVFLAFIDLSDVKSSASEGIAFSRELLTKLNALPGVESATLADFSPENFTLHSEDVQPEGYVRSRNESMEMDRGIVGPGYLKTMRVKLLEGREFTDQDNDTTEPVAMVNQVMADRYWPGQDAIGKRVQIWGRWYKVVGVTANGKYRRVTYEPAPLVLTPLFQRYTSELIIHVRTVGEPQNISSAVQAAVHQVNPELPIFNITTVAASMKMGSMFERIVAVFAGSFGLLALILAEVGIYGVVAYATKQRTHEIGIRMALGAQRTDVFRQVLGHGLRLALAGIGIGIAISLIVTRFLQGMLFGVGVADTATFVAVSVALCTVALAACYFPARHAADVHPMESLRYE